MDGRTNTARKTGAPNGGAPGGRRPGVVGDSALDRVRPDRLSSGGKTEQMDATEQDSRPEKGGTGTDFTDSPVPGRERPHKAWTKAQVGKVKHHKTRLMRCAKLLSHAAGAMREIGLDRTDIALVESVRAVVMNEYWKEVEKDRLRLKDYNRQKQREHRGQ